MSKALARKFVSSDDAVAIKTQHRKPCADCPFARTAIRGWLGLSSIKKNKIATPEEWIEIAHGEKVEICHCTTSKECAGLAIFRANVFKLPKHALILEPDTTLVFANDQEFKAHHTRTK